MKSISALSTALLLLLAGNAAAAEIRVTVRYRTPTTIYLSGGSADGLVVGDRLSVTSKGAAIGELQVTYVAEHSASCSIARETKPIQLGDIASITKAAPSAETKVADTKPAATSAVTAPTVSTSALVPRPGARLVPWARVRGSMSLGWYRTWDQTPTGYDFEQRSGRLDLGLWDVLGRPMQINVRGRGRQDLRTRPLGSTFEGLPLNERRDRLYELSLRYAPPSGRFSVEGGRLGEPTLGVGTMDGGNVEVRALGALHVGGFAGQRADVENLTGFQRGPRYGAYLRLAGGGPGWPGRYDAMAYGVREKGGSEVSREYVGFQGRLGTRRFTTYQWAEVDVLRGWRQRPFASRYQLSNLSASASYRLGNSGSAGLSYDQRRNYRTLETRSVSEALFDRFLHQGFRASLDINRGRGFGLSAYGGLRLKEGTTGQSWSYGGGLRHLDLFGSGLGASLDGAAFASEFTQGQQASVRLSRMTGDVTGDLSYGASRYTLKSPAGGVRLDQWLRFSLRVDMRGLWIGGDTQYDVGDDAKGPRASFEVGYRF